MACCHGASESAVLDGSQSFLTYLGDTWWIWLILVPCIAVCVYFFVAFCLIMAGGICSVCHLVLGELLIRRRMRAAHRFLTRDQVQEKAAAGTGTILVDSPTVGWGVTRAWWTDDDVLSIAPEPPQRSDKSYIENPLGHPFDVWCHGKYTNPIHGGALLFAVWRGEKRAKRLVKKFPTLRMVTVWSGGAEAADWGVQSEDKGDPTCTLKQD